MRGWFIIIFIAILGCNPDEFENPSPDFVYFMVAEYPVANRGDSYILPLSDPDDIQMAREIIANPEDVTDKIVVARIERQSENRFIKNKDLLRSFTWSWNVVEFLGFAGSTIEILDGNPSFVEADLDSWFQNTANSNEFGVVGFWGYTVVGEVSQDELK